MPQDNGISEAQLAQLEAAGKLLPVNQTPTVRPDVTPRGGPPAPQQQPQNFSGTLPQNLQYTPDIERTRYGAGTSEYRLMPVGPGGVPSNVSAAQSTAQKVINEQTGSGQIGSLQMPSIFSVSGAKPVTSNGNAIVVGLQPENAGTFLAGPVRGNGSQATFDKQTISNAASTTSVSVGPLTPTSPLNEWAIMVISAVTPAASFPGIVPGLGWTALQPATGSNNQGLSWFQNVTSSVTGTAVLGSTAQYAAALALFYAPGGPPSIVQSKYGPVLGTGGYSVAFASNLTAKNSVLVLIESVNTTGQPTFSSFTDTQGNIYNHISSEVETHLGNTSSVDIYYAENVVGGADTITFTTAGGQAGQGIVWIAEISGLEMLAGQVIFRNIFQSDLLNAVFNPSGVNHSVGAVPDPGSSAGTTRFLREDATWDNPLANAFYQTVQQAGVSKPQEAKLNFLAPITATDNSGNGSTDIAVPVFVASGASHATGLVPDPGSSAGTTRFLREDATWVAPPSIGGVNIQTTNYTAQASDLGKMIVLNGGSVSPSFGSPAFVTGGVGALAAVHTLTTLNTAAGDLIVVAVSWVDSNSRTITSVTDTAGNTYTPLTASGHSSGNNIVQMFYVIGATANAANTITANFSGAVSQNANICAWDCSATGSVSLDAQNATTGTSATPTSGAFSTTGTTEIVFVCISDAQTPATAGSGYTLDNGQFNSAGQANSAAQHRTFSTTQSGITASMTASANAFFAIAVAAFKATASAATLTLKLPASPPSSTWNIFMNNIGSGAATVDPNGLSLDGVSSPLTGINQYTGMYITTDGTNYYSMRGGA